MNVFIDLDGVIADFVHGAMEVHDKPWPFKDDVHGDDAWDVPRLWEMTEHDFFAPMGFDFWKGLRKTSEADQIMDILNEAYGWSNLCFLSTPCQTPGCVEGKTAWVHEHYPDLPLLLAIPTLATDAPAPKHAVAHRNAVLIDDNTHNVTRFREAGGWGILFPRPWNACWHLQDQWQEHLMTGCDYYQEA